MNWQISRERIYESMQRRICSHGRDSVYYLLLGGLKIADQIVNDQCIEKVINDPLNGHYGRFISHVQSQEPFK